MHSEPALWDKHIQNLRFHRNGTETNVLTGFIGRKTDITLKNMTPDLTTHTILALT